MDTHDACQLQIETLTRERDAAESANRELRVAIAALERASGNDLLTGAWNRHRFEETAAMEIALAQRRKTNVSLLILDVDFLKRINEAQGLPAGDAILVRLTQLLKEQLRASDALARWGGDEFAVLMPATRLDGAMNLAEKIRRAISEQAFPGVGRVTVSIGVAEFSADMDFEAWVFLTDEALYSAKALGRNRVEAGPGESDSWGTPTLLELVWDEAYCCGEPTIDAQHQRLFSLANSLFGAITGHQPPSEVSSRMLKLMDHLAQHFRDEETLLEQAGYAQFPAHAAEHQRLLSKVAKLQQAVAAGSLDTLLLIDFLVMDVVRNHLVTEDQKFFTCFQKAKA
jgi:diguanylate cyclase (GGDEF)-like protein/hemerythrin-like metal-binding protein